MAGKRGKNLKDNKQIKVMLPRDLIIELTLEAEEHGHSFAEEVRRRLLFSFGDGVTMSDATDQLYENFKTQVAWQQRQ